jgi:tRNA-dihydrouridine synthase B
MEIGPYQLSNNVVLAPMAGVTDLPFRRLCRQWGAGLTVSEMISADATLRDTSRTRRRMNHDSEPAPVTVQIAGADPSMLADAARYNVECGAHIIDINMGCPAKKVCRKRAGSALLSDEKLVARIFEAVVSAVPVPVTIKIRTGPHPGRRNAVAVARLAEAAGIQAISVHGRTRACGFHGAVEYDTVREVKRSVDVPVIVNGDIDSPHKAAEALQYTGADGVMIGRAAQGRPWLLGQVAAYLETGTVPAEPAREAQRRALLTHLVNLYAFYGERRGVRIARKHIHWYTKTISEGEKLWHCVNQVEDSKQQYRLMAEYFHPARHIYLRAA